MKYHLLSIVLLVIFTSCGKKLTGETPRTDIGVGDTVYLESGVKYVFNVMSEDTVSIVAGTSVTTHINLEVNDSIVWSTYGPPLRPFGFVYMQDRMIDGFNEVIAYLKSGDRVTAIIPPELGYGSQGAGETIPPNAVLQFDIEVISIN